MSAKTGMYPMQYCVFADMLFVFATPTHIGVACIPCAFVPSQCKDINMGYVPLAHVLQAWAKLSPNWTPAP